MAAPITIIYINKIPKLIHVIGVAFEILEGSPASVLGSDNGTGGDGGDSGGER